jgi:hypothetical protein
MIRMYVVQYIKILENNFTPVLTGKQKRIEKNGLILSFPKFYPHNYEGLTALKGEGNGWRGGGISGHYTCNLLLTAQSQEDLHVLHFFHH